MRIFSNHSLLLLISMKSKLLNMAYGLLHALAKLHYIISALLSWILLKIKVVPLPSFLTATL